MKLTYLVFFIAALTLPSCLNINNRPPHTKPSISKDTLLYTYKVVGAAECVNKPDTDCEITRYPVFKNQAALNDSLTNRIAKLFGQSEKKPTGKINMQSNVIRQDSSLITIQISGYISPVGMSKKSRIRFVNWDTKAVKEIELKNILVEGYADKLNKIAEKIFRKQEKLSDTASLARDYMFNEAKFSLNNNYVITPLGIKFLFNVGEIKPAAAGQTDLLIPYAQIKSLLQPNTVVKQYIK